MNVWISLFTWYSIPWSGLGPWGCQSASRSILFVVDKCSLLLNTSTLSWVHYRLVKRTPDVNNSFGEEMETDIFFWYSAWLISMYVLLVCPKRVSWNIDSYGGWVSPLYILNKKMTSARFLLSSRVLSFSFSSSSSYFLSLNSGSILINLRYTFSINCLSFL